MKKVINTLLSLLLISSNLVFAETPNIVEAPTAPPISAIETTNNPETSRNIDINISTEETVKEAVNKTPTQESEVKPDSNTPPKEGNVIEVPTSTNSPSKEEQAVEPTATPEIEKTPIETIAPTEPTVEPTKKPIEEKPIETVVPTEKPVETIAPSETPAETEKPAETVQPSEQPTDTSCYTNITDEEFIGMTEAGRSMIVFFGNSKNLDEVINTMSTVYSKVDKIQDAVYRVEDVKNVEGIKGLIPEQTNKDMFDKALEFGGIIQTFNGEVTSVMVTEKIADEMTWDRVALVNISLFVPEAIENVAMFARANSLPSIGKEWSFGSKSKLQPFTAPISGTYTLELWGASGDSDLGDVGYWSQTPTFGAGGAGGYSKGDIVLSAGQTIYLALGQQNGLTTTQKYNGGGTGAGAESAFLSGGGGAASAYTEPIGNGELKKYENNKDKVIMVAGGGGGAEDFFDTNWKGERHYPCSQVGAKCFNARGGAGNSSQAGTSTSGDNGAPGSFQFGQGQKYAGNDNASTGGGGGGWMGGSSARGANSLKGGTGGGGSGYINNSLVTNGSMTSQPDLTVDYITPTWWEIPGYHASAKITLKNLTPHKLTIDYVDDLTDEKIATTYEGTYKTGETYSVPSPSVDGYSVVKLEDRVVEGTMPDKDVHLVVRYNYTKVIINYLNYETKEVLYPQYYEAMKTGTPYDVKSPDINGFVRLDDTQDRITGVKIAKDEEFTVYYVESADPTKHIVAVNGHPVSQEQSNAGVQLKTGDIVTYELRYKNNRGIPVTETAVDELPSTLKYVSDNSNPDTPTVNGNRLSWTFEIPARSTKNIKFKAEVVDSRDNPITVNNWTREDPIIKYEVTKSSKPESGTDVGYNQEIEYTLTLKNTGSNKVNNILVVDKIPEHLTFTWIDTLYTGSYNKQGNYVRFVVDELVPGQVVELKFSATVVTQISDNSTYDIINTARYQNFSSPITDSSKDDDVMNNGIITNKTVHHLKGPIMDVVKSANPANGTAVQSGQTITYKLDMVNIGTVNSNFLRLTDDIPAGATYVPGSLQFVYNGQLVSGVTREAINRGQNFDIRYDFNRSKYVIENVRNISDVNVLEINWGWRLALSTSGSLPGGWSKQDTSNGMILKSNSRMNSGDIKRYLESLTFTGAFGEGSEITINTKKYIQKTHSATYVSLDSHGGNVEAFTAPVNGKYRIEAWGAQGGHDWGVYYGGKGGYVAADITLNRNQTIYAQAGHEGWVNKASSDALSTNVFNGGGHNSIEGTTGGGASSWTLTNRGELRNFAGFQGEVLIVAGGGGGADNNARINGGDGGASNSGGGNFGQGSNARKAGGGGGWNGGAGGKGGTNHINYSQVTNASSQAGANGWNGQPNQGQEANGKASIRLISINDPNAIFDGNTLYTIENGSRYATPVPTVAQNIPAGSNPNGCKFVTSNGAPYVECIVSNVEVGKKATMEFQVTVDNPFPSNLSQVENTGYFETSWNNPGRPGDNPTKPKTPTNTVIHPVNGKAPNIVAVKDSNPVSGTEVQPFDIIQYSIKVQNTGNGKANYVVVRDNIPARTTFAGGLNEGGVYKNENNKQFVEWIFPLEKGEVKTLTFSVEVNRPDKEGVYYITNTAEFDLFSEKPLPDIMLTKKTNQIKHKVQPLIPGKPSSDYTVKKSSNPPSGTMINRGDNIEYYIDVEANPNSGFISWIKVRDVVPNGTTLVTPMSYEIVNGCKNIIVELNNNTNTQDALIDGLKAGDKLRLKFTVKVDKETLLSEIENIALYDESTEKPSPDKEPMLSTDPVTHPLTSHLVTAVKSSDPVAGDKMENASLVKRGENIAYTIAVTNNGTGMANYVVVKDTLPAHTSFISTKIKTTTNDKDRVEFVNDHIEAVMYDLAVGETREIEMVVNVDDTTPQGTYIYNHALFDSSITSLGDIGGINIPDDKAHSTNETVHVVDFMSHALETGGEGWGNILPIVGGVALIGGVIIVLVSRKKKGE